MTSTPMQIVSGRVIAASQQSVAIDVYSQNVGWTKEQSEEITLRLDSSDLPLVLKTAATESMFIARDDQLDIACIEHAGRLAIYGIRNATDGSLYLVRTANVASARMDIVVTIFCLAVLAICGGIIGLIGRSANHLPDIYLPFAGAAIGLFVLSTVLRSGFGFILWPGIRKLGQPGGRREMNAAREALALKPEEARHVRVL